MLTRAALKLADWTVWTGSASDLLRLCTERARENTGGTAWTRNPRTLAGRLRRAQTFLRTLGIEITFCREGRTGTRMIRMSTSTENTLSTVSIVGTGSNSQQSTQPYWVRA
jgi:hypothetical protein